MAPEGTKDVEVEVDGKKYAIKVFSENGKVYASINLPDFGEITVPDFGQGESRAIREIRGRVGLYIRDAKTSSADTED